MKRDIKVQQVKTAEKKMEWMISLWIALHISSLQYITVCLWKLDIQNSSEMRSNPPSTRRSHKAQIFLPKTSKTRGVNPRITTAASPTLSTPPQSNVLIFHPIQPSNHCQMCIRHQPRWVRWLPVPSQQRHDGRSLFDDNDPNTWLSRRQQITTLCNLNPCVCSPCTLLQLLTRNPIPEPMPNLLSMQCSDDVHGCYRSTLSAKSKCWLCVAIKSDPFPRA